MKILFALLLGLVIQRPLLAQAADKPRDYFLHPYSTREEYGDRFAPKENAKHIEVRLAKTVNADVAPIWNARVEPGFMPSGFWLTNDLIIANAAQDNADADEKRLQRVVLIDAKNGRSTTLVESGRFLCWNSEREIISIAPSIYNKKTRGHLMRLSTSGALSEVSDADDINEENCRAKSIVTPKGKLLNLLRDSDGYLLREIKIKPGNEGGIDETVLYRPGSSPKVLPVRATEVSAAIYMPYWHGYLLGNRDSQNQSSTDRRLGGANWGRPYELTPYRFLLSDGSIKEIAYPSTIFEYGIKSFDYFTPARAGNVIAASAYEGEYGLYLVSNANVVKIYDASKEAMLWSKGAWFGDLILSPDGCQILFRHLRKNLFSAKNQYLIINVCGVN